MDKQSVIEKIKKCLALSKSSNEHEAAAAMRQAQALMNKYNVNSAEMQIADVSQARIKSNARSRFPAWEGFLAGTVAKAFGCECIHQSSWADGHWLFIGHGAAPQTSEYAFDILIRQIKKQRSAFIKNKCIGLPTKHKRRRADLFCEGWIASVRSKVQDMAPSEQQRAAVDLFMQKHYSKVSQTKAKFRSSQELTDGEAAAFLQGEKQGKDVHLHHGVGASTEQPLALGGSHV